MRRLLKLGLVVAVCVAWAASTSVLLAQESPAARATRKRLKQKITVEFPKETRIKEVVEEIRRELNNRVSIKIDNTSGISNNSKVTIVAKDQPVTKVLNDLCNRYDMGYYVKSDPKDRYDGWIILRKSKYKERGYEGGKEPKKKASLQTPPPGTEWGRSFLFCSPSPLRGRGWDPGFFSHVWPPSLLVIRRL